MDINLVNQDDSWRTFKYNRSTSFVHSSFSIRHKIVVLCNRFDGNVCNEGKHHLLARAQITERLRPTANRQNDLIQISIEPHIVSVRNTSDNGLANYLKSRPHVSATPGGDKFVSEPLSQVGESDPLIKAVIKRCPTTRRPILAIRYSLVGWEPGASSAIIRDHRTENVLTSLISTVYVLDRRNRFLSLRICRSCSSLTNLAFPAHIVITAYLPCGRDNGRSLLPK